MTSAHIFRECHMVHNGTQMYKKNRIYTNGVKLPSPTKNWLVACMAASPAVW